MLHRKTKLATSAYLNQKSTCSDWPRSHPHVIVDVLFTHSRKHIVRNEGQILVKNKPTSTNGLGHIWMLLIIKRQPLHIELPLQDFDYHLRTMTTTFQAPTQPKHSQPSKTRMNGIQYRFIDIGIPTFKFLPLVQDFCTYLRNAFIEALCLEQKWNKLAAL